MKIGKRELYPLAVSIGGWMGRWATGTFRTQVRTHAWTSLPLLLIASAATMAWSQGGQPAAKPLAPIRVEECNITAWKSVVLAFDRPGILSKLDVQEGDTVTAGQFLASLKDDVARAAFEVARIQADSDVEIVFAGLAAELAKTEHERMLEANRKRPGTIPELEVRKAQLNHDKAIAELNKAKHNRDVLIAKRDEAKAQWDTFRLEAPFDGFITKLPLTEGASVKQGDAVISLLNTSKLKVAGTIPVNAKDVEHLHPGCKAEIQLSVKEAGEAAARTVHTGTVIFVDSKSSNFGIRVVAEIENTEQLLRAGLSPSMTVYPTEKSK